MGIKKAKIIEFDEETIERINRYGDSFGINTFSGVIRVMVENELIKHGFGGNKSNDEYNTSKVVSKLNAEEQQQWKEICEHIEIYQQAEVEFKKLRSTLSKAPVTKKKPKPKTRFEELILHFSDDKNVEKLYEMVQRLFVRKGSEIITVTEAIGQLREVLLRKNMSFTLSDLKQMDNADDIKALIKDKAMMDREEGFISIKNMAMRRENNSNHKDDYNEVVEKYFEYKQGNISKYVMIRLLSEYIEIMA